MSGNAYYSGYRDSYFQGVHYTQPHHSLYREWMDDARLPPPDEMNGDLGHRNGVDRHHNQDGRKDTREKESALRSKYWEFFDDEEDWEVFNRFNMTVESNGRLVYKHVVGDTEQNRQTAASITAMNPPQMRTGNNNPISNTTNNQEATAAATAAANQQHQSATINGNNNNNITSADIAATINPAVPVGATNSSNAHAAASGDASRHVTSGSLFDPRTITRIRGRVDAWTDRGSVGERKI